VDSASALTLGTPCNLTIVVSAYNSEQTIANFLHLLIDVVHAMPTVTLHQLIIVDDCSTDHTFEVAKSLTETISALRVIRLSRNRGQQTAISAGVAVATGDLTLVMDDDGQNPIDEIPNLVRRSVDTSSDVVIATSRHRSLGRQITSRLFWLAMRSSRLASEPESQLMMRVLSRRVVDAFKSYPENTRTVYGIVRDIGYKTEGFEVRIGPHVSGKESSRYSFGDRLEVFIDTYLTSANKPFAFLLRTSAVLLSLGALLMLGVVLSDMDAQSNRAVLLMVTGFASILVSVAMFSTFIILRLLSLIFLEARRRPLFHIDKDTGSPRCDSVECF
jgi:glycosyltransferase involved in cell wall biosynthesis